MSTTQAALKPTVPEQGASHFKQALVLVLRLFGAFVAMLFAYTISGMLVRVDIPPAPQDGISSGTALLIVSFLTSMALAYPVLRARWFGLKLMAAILLVMFGVETFMTQIETLFFNGALKLPMDVLTALVAAGFLRALIFAPLAVLVLGKFRGETIPQDPPRFKFSIAGWVIRFAILSVLYVMVYFAFGYFVAMQWAAAREFYNGTFTADVTLPLFQILRGAMWAALGLLIAAMMRGKAWETWLAVAMVFGVLVAAPVIFPNPFMPAMVRQAHFFELSSSMLFYGAVAGWVWTRAGHKK